MAETLATFMHISDLHIGDIDWAGKERGDSPLDPMHKKWWKLHRLFAGYWGHEHSALRAIVEKWVDLQLEDARPRVVFTGDLTACGRESQFLAGATYLSSRLCFGRNHLLGINDRSALRLATSGNHDQWPGSNRILGTSSRACQGIFGPFPRLEEVRIDDKVQAIFVVINTDADIDPYGPGRLAAQGAFASQLEEAKTLLAGKKDDHFRILLMHHTTLVKEGLTEGIREGTRTRLKQFVKDEKIQVILCGHMHSPSAGMFTSVPEYCAGTAAQRCNPPKGSQSSQSGQINSMFLHRVIREKDKYSWESELLVRMHTDFVSHDKILKKDSDYKRSTQLILAK